MTVTAGRAIEERIAAIRYATSVPYIRPTEREKELFIDNLQVRIHLIVEMILVDRPCADRIRVRYKSLGVVVFTPHTSNPQPHTDFFRGAKDRLWRRVLGLGYDGVEGGW